MPLDEMVAAVGLLGVILYGVLGGADFGGGIWDLFASGPRRLEQRQAIAKAMGPVWEANHVWLIFVIVVLFTAFPSAFAALSIGLFGIFHLVLVGIILRGAAFVFRGSHLADEQRSPWGTVFGAASVITPTLLGMAVGAVSSGRIRVVDGEVQTAGLVVWLGPISLLIGAVALSLCSYLAAVYLANEAAGELRDDFHRRALQSGTVVTALTIIALPVCYFDSPHLWDGLISARAAPVLVLGLISALLSGWALWRRRYRLAKVATIGQVSLLLFGWGLAQYPYLVYPDVTIADAAAPDVTIRFVLYSLPFGAALVLPSLWFLFRVFKQKAI